MNKLRKLLHDDPERPLLLRYGCAIASVALGAWMGILLDPVPAGQAPFAPLFLAILLTAWYGGTRPALFATILGLVFANYFLLEQVGQLALYAGVGVGIATLGGLMQAGSRASLRKLQASAEALEQIQGRFQFALRCAGMSAWIWELGRNVVESDENCSRLYGHGPGELIATIEQLMEKVHPDDRNRVQRELAAAIEQGVEYNSEFRIVWGDGTVHFLTGRGKVDYDRAGQPVRLSGVSRDVTERRQIEDALRAVSGRLPAEGKFRELLEAAPDAIVVVNRTREIVFVNVQAQHLLGYAREELMGQTPDLLMPERFREEHPGLVFEFFANPQVPPTADAVDLYARRKDGTEFPVEISQSTLETEDGSLVITIRDITERKRAEMGREQLASIVDYSDDAIIGKSLDGTIVNWNKGAERLYGYSIDEVRGKPISILLPANYQDELLEIISRLNRGEVTTEETVRRRKDGKLIDVALTVSPIWDSRGRLTAASSIARDISARKRAESKFRCLLEAAPDAVVVTNPEGSIVLVNTQLEKLFGYVREELLGQNIKMLVPGYTTGPNHVLSAVRSREELRGRPKNGTEFPVEISSGPLETDEGVLVSSSIRDVAERRAIQDQLGHSRTVLQGLFEALPGMFMVMTPDLKIVSASNAFLEATAARREDLVGRGVFDIFPDQPGTSTIASWRASLDRVRTTGSTDTMAVQRYDIRRSDGVIEERYWSPMNCPVIGAAGQIEYFIHRVTDVTEFVRQKSSAGGDTIGPLTRLEHMEAEVFHNSQELENANRQLHATNSRFLQAKAEAEAANRAKSTFLSTMSHEIRTPMNAILGYAQLMLRDQGIGEETKASLEVIRSSGEHLLALINDILDMSKVEAGRTELNPVTFNLGGLLDDLSKMFRLRAKAKSLRFETTICAASVCYIKADESKIRQVLINLLGNAIKFTTRGTVRLRVALENDSVDQPWLSVSVEDSGPGMTDDEQKQLFQPFSQTSRDVSAPGRVGQEGTGLGLAISRGFARLMGGDITVTSVPDTGSTFRFEVPVRLGNAEALAPENDPGNIIGLPEGAQAPRILVVDDLLENRDWLMKMLTQSGFSVRGADSGESAIDVWKDWKPQLILMDRHMPLTDGLEATRRIKADPRGSETLIVALTASAMNDDRRDVTESGADGFLAKPCLRSQLLETIGRLLKLTYVYEAVSGNGATALSEVAALNARMPANLQPEVVEDLLNSTQSGNKTRLNELILAVRLAGGAEVAGVLQGLADNYDYDGLIRLLETASQRVADS